MCDDGSMDMHYFDKALSHFAASDPIMHAALMAALEGERALTLPIKKPADCYRDELFSSIISQQLSVKAAATIWRRFINIYGDPVDTKKVLSADLETLRSVGLSRQKATYIQSIARGTTDGTVRLDHLDTLDNETVIAELVTLKGVGSWTAEMFLIFTLGRPDVFSIGDLGLRNAAARLYQRELSRDELLSLSVRWSPFRSAASLALWHSLDNAPKN